MKSSKQPYTCPSPGEWCLSEDGKDILAETRGQENGWYEIEMGIFNPHDARLMVAAPKLLQALENMLNEDDGPIWGEGFDNPTDVLGIAKVYRNELIQQQQQKEKSND